MTVAKDSRLEIYRGFNFSVTYNLNNSTTNEPINLSGKTFSAKMKNLTDEDYQDVGTVTTQPSGTVGQIRLDGSVLDSELFTVPDYEPSEQYPEISAKILIVDENNIPYVDINVAVIG